MNIPRESGDLHAHTEYSLRDSNKTIKDYVSTAKEMGLYAIAITDHGTCMGWTQFYKACKEAGIKGILGVEGYVEGSYGNREHLTLLAANRDGYKRISRIVSESNDNIIGDFPIITYDNLTRNLTGSNGSVFVLSGCVQGVLASELLKNKEIERKAARLTAWRNRYCSPDDPKLLSLREQLKEAEQLFEEANGELKETKTLAEMKFTQKKRALKVLKESDPELYAEKMKQIEEQEEESAEAKAVLPSLKKTVAQLRKNASSLRSEAKEAEKKTDKWTSYNAQIEELYGSMQSPEELYTFAVKKARWFQNLVGFGGFFIELQYHGLDIEAEVMPKLSRLAYENGIPVVATNDSHMAKRDETDKLSFVRSLRFAKWHEATDIDKEEYIKDNTALAEALSNCGIPGSSIEIALKNIKWIADKCTCDYFDDRDYYPKYRDESGNIVKDSATLLRRFAAEGIAKRYKPGEFTEQYRQRMEYELNTIIELGYADYLLIVQDFINYAKTLAPYGVGPGRGSGAGSLVCYLLGITNIDPIPLNLLFERFLNRERVSMPDIDTDFSDEIREQVIDYVTRKYGKECVAYISTVMTQAAKASVKNAARVKGWEMYPVDEDKYTALKIADNENSTKKATTYRTEMEQKQKEVARLGDLICKEIPDKPGIKLEECMDLIKQKYHDDMSEQILQMASRVEGSVSGYGIHAAGIIISDGTPIKDIVPTVYMPQKKVTAIQCDMVQAEEKGLLKFDFLGLVNLYIISDTIREIQARTGRQINPDELPLDDADVYKKIFAAGETDAVFQFESDGMKDMLRRFRPGCFEDVVLLVAAYRPGPMQYLDGIIRTKTTGKHEATCLTKLPQIRDIISVTYDSVVYQEQVMQIFQRLAGYTLGQSDIVRRAMSKKKFDKLAQEREAFLNGDPERGIKGCAGNGVNLTLANELFDQMMDFASYAFNKSHAAAYAYIAYITAWFKLYYPSEYMCSVIKHTKLKKLPFMLGACRQMGIKVLQPDINCSQESFSIDTDGNIRYGLSSIKGVASAAEAILKERQENGAYRSFKDFIVRAHKKNDITIALIKAGAFLSLEPTANRTGMLEIADKCISMAKKLQNYTNKIAELTTASASTKKEESTIERSLASAQSGLKNAQEEFDNTVLYQLPEDGATILKEEKELLGVYCSGHPLDYYEKAINSAEVTPIRNASVEKHVYAGIIGDMRIARRKSDGRPLAFFTLEDKSGIINCCCFVKAFELYHRYIEDGAAVKIQGKVEKKETLDPDGEMETETNLFVEEISYLPKNRDSVMLTFKDGNDYAMAFDDIKKTVIAEGLRLIIHLESTGKLIEAPDTFLVRNDIDISDVHGCKSVTRFKGGAI